FQLGLRLSPERFGLVMIEIRRLAGELLAGGDLDYLDMSLWDVFKEPVDEAFKGRPLIDWFADLPRGGARLGVAGKILGAESARRALDHGADFVITGRAAVLHHDYPQRVAADPQFHPVSLPVTREYLRGEGLGPTFIHYMNNWKGFVADEAEEAA
ncbi:MAG: NADH:flavin oxidoreductase, partial [Steroidobacteraceae bacterium]